MNQKKLHRTIDSIASKYFHTVEDMLIKTSVQIVENEKIDIIGARIWKLIPEKRYYKLLHQNGKIQKISPNFSLKIIDSPIFDIIAKERTVLGIETNEELKKKGITKYSASGIGEKIKVNGRFYFEYVLAISSEQINDELRYSLNIIAATLTSQIKQRRFSASMKNYKEGLDKARQLQQSILPQHELKFHDYEIFGVTVPAEIVGGDFFDYIESGVNDDRLVIILGDAASKGVSAAAEAMYISGALRMACTFELKITPLMRRMNQLVNKIFSDDKFTSLFYCELSVDKTGLFLYSNAGHNPPLFVRSESDEIIYLDSTGPVLGPSPTADYTMENINFSTGDTLVIFSDGVTESTDDNFNPFGDEKLEELVVKNKNLSAKEISYKIIESVIKFSKEGSYSDDKTVVVIKRVK